MAYQIQSCGDISAAKQARAEKQATTIRPTEQQAATPAGKK